MSQWLATFGLGQAATWSASTELEGSPLDRNLYTALLVCGLIVLVRRRQEAWRLLKANLPIVLFFLYCAASVFWSDYSAVSFKRWIKAVGDLVMVMIVLTDPDPLAAIKRLLARTSFLVVPLSILVAKYYPDIGTHFIRGDGRRFINGLTTDKNALGSLCMLFGVGFLWRFLAAYLDREGTHRTRHLIVHGTLLAMAMWLFSQANSITSLLCFVLASSLIVATSFPALARNRAAVNLLVASVLAAAALPLFLDIGGSLLKTVGRDATLTGRTAIWREALAVDTRPILGAGFESFWLGAPLDDRGFSFHVNEAHNGYLEVYLNLGWVGVVLLLVAIVIGYRNIIGVLRQHPEAGSLRLAFWAIGLIYSLSEAGFRMMNLVWICFLLAATAVPRRSVQQTSRARALRPIPSGVPALRGASAVTWKSVAKHREVGGAKRTEAPWATAGARRRPR